MQLVKFDCGCVGFAPDDNGRAMIIEDCTRDHWDWAMGLGSKNMVDKTWENLSPTDNEAKVQEISKLIHDGNRFREIKSLLS